MKTADDPIHIVKAKDCTLYAADGKHISMPFHPGGKIFMDMQMNTMPTGFHNKQKHWSM
jgi:hypothetical protein